MLTGSISSDRTIHDLWCHAAVFPDNVKLHHCCSQATARRLQTVRSRILGERLNKEVNRRLGTSKESMRW